MEGNYKTFKKSLTLLWKPQEKNQILIYQRTMNVLFCKESKF